MKVDEDNKMKKKCAPFPMDNEVAMIDEVGHHSGSNGTELMALLFGHTQEDYEEIVAYACADNFQKNICSDKSCQGFKICH